MRSRVSEFHPYLILGTDCIVHITLVKLLSNTHRHAPLHVNRSIWCGIFTWLWHAFKLFLCACVCANCVWSRPRCTHAHWGWNSITSCTAKSVQFSKYSCLYRVSILDMLDLYSAQERLLLPSPIHCWTALTLCVNCSQVNLRISALQYSRWRLWAAVKHKRSKEREISCSISDSIGSWLPE